MKELDEYRHKESGEIVQIYCHFQDCKEVWIYFGYHVYNEDEFNELFEKVEDEE